MKLGGHRVAEHPGEPRLTLSLAGTFLSQGYMLIGAVILKLAVARFLGPVGNGQYSLAVNIYGVLSIVAGLGLGQANVYFVGKRADVREVLANSILVAGAAGLSALILMLFFNKTISALLSNLPGAFLLVIAAALPGQLLLIFSRHIFLGQGRVGTYNFIRGLETTWQVIFLTLLITTSRLNVWGAVLSMLAGSLVTLLTSLYLLRRSLSLKINLVQLKQSLSYGVKAYFAETAQFFNFRLDIFLVAFFLNMRDVGSYALAVSLSQILYNMPAALSTVLFSTSANATESKMDSLTPRACRLLVFFLLIFSGLAYFFIPYLIELTVGAAYLSAGLPLKILLPGTIALGVYQVLYADLAGRGRPQIGVYASTAALALTLIFDVLLIPWKGVAGAAMASTIAYSCGAAVMLIGFKKLTSRSIQDLLVIRRNDLVAVRDSLMLTFRPKDRRA